MLKKLTILLMFFATFCAAIASDKIKIAILDSSKADVSLADYVSGQLNSEKYDVLERSEIKKIIKEQNISRFSKFKNAIRIGKLCKVELFAVVSLENVVVFESHYGIRILSHKFTTDNFEKKAQEAVIYIEKSFNKLKNLKLRKQYFLSILPTRNAGVYKEKAKLLKNIQDEINDLIVNDENIIILEREYTNSLVQEKALTNIAQQIMSSGSVGLLIGTNSSKSNNEIIIRYYIKGENEFGTKNCEFVLEAGNEKKIAEKVYRYIIKNLKAIKKEKINVKYENYNKREAFHFYNEWKKLKKIDDLDNALKAIDCAYMLDESNLALKLNTEWSIYKRDLNKIPVKQRFKDIDSILNKVEEFYDRYKMVDKLERNIFYYSAMEFLGYYFRSIRTKCPRIEKVITKYGNHCFELYSYRYPQKIKNLQDVKNFNYALSSHRVEGADFCSFYIPYIICPMWAKIIKNQGQLNFNNKNIYTADTGKLIAVKRNKNKDYDRIFLSQILLIENSLKLRYVDYINGSYSMSRYLNSGKFENVRKIFENAISTNQKEYIFWGLKHLAYFNKYRKDGIARTIKYNKTYKKNLPLDKYMPPETSFDELKIAINKLIELGVDKKKLNIRLSFIFDNFPEYKEDLISLIDKGFYSTKNIIGKKQELTEIKKEVNHNKMYRGKLDYYYKDRRYDGYFTLYEKKILYRNLKIGTYSSRAHYKDGKFFIVTNKFIRKKVGKLYKNFVKKRLVGLDVNKKKVYYGKELFSEDDAFYFVDSNDKYYITKAHGRIVFYPLDLSKPIVIKYPKELGWVDDFFYDNDKFFVELQNRNDPKSIGFFDIKKEELFILFSENQEQNNPFKKNRFQRVPELVGVDKKMENLLFLEGMSFNLKNKKWSKIKDKKLIKKIYKMSSSNHLKNFRLTNNKTGDYFYTGSIYSSEFNLLLPKYNKIIKLRGYYDEYGFPNKILGGSIDGYVLYGNLVVGKLKSAEELNKLKTFEKNKIPLEEL